MIRTSVLPRIVLRRGLLAGAAVTATLVLSACGSSDSGSTGTDTGGMPTPASSAASSSATFNDADVAFTQHMIGHHQQAIEMAAMAESRAADADVKTLAAKIKAAQQPEIDTMDSWLTAWDKPAAMPSASSSMPGMDSGHMDMDSMPGAMSKTDMNKLMDAKGPAFDKMFLTMMVAHHQGAVDMAQQEAGQGSNPDAVALAKKIITDQRTEITQMKGMLAKR